MRHFAILVLPALHLGFCLFIQFANFEGSWGWFLAFLVDLPFSVLLLPLGKYLSGFVCFGVFGTLWWFFLSWLVARLVGKGLRIRESPHKWWH
jgi:hypothetical protein